MIQISQYGENPVNQNEPRWTQLTKWTKMNQMNQDSENPWTKMNPVNQNEPKWTKWTDIVRTQLGKMNQNEPI